MGSDLSDFLRQYKYQPELTKKLDDLDAVNLTPELLNEIVLWKVNRYVSLGLLARLKAERFSLCPACTREVPPDLQRDSGYQARWTPFVKQMLTAFKRGVRWHSFKPKFGR